PKTLSCAGPEREAGDPVAPRTWRSNAHFAPAPRGRAEPAPGARGRLLDRRLRAPADARTRGGSPTGAGGNAAARHHHADGPGDRDDRDDRELRGLRERRDGAPAGREPAGPAVRRAHGGGPLEAESAGSPARPAAQRHAAGERREPPAPANRTADAGPARSALGRGFRP